MLKTVNNDDEHLLLSRLREGGERAFAGIYELYAGKIYQRLLNLLKDEDMADSLLQDVFLRIWEKRANIDPAQPFKAYLFKIAENLVYDHFRKLSRDLKMQAKLKLAMTELYTHSEEAVFKKENEALLKEAMISCRHSTNRCSRFAVLRGSLMKKLPNCWAFAFDGQ